MKCLFQALMKEYGEREWAELSEKERQRKLIDLKIRERQLRKEGKMHEIANIIGSHLENEKCEYSSHLEKTYNLSHYRNMFTLKTDRPHDQAETTLEGCECAWDH